MLIDPLLAKPTGAATVTCPGWPPTDTLTTPGSAATVTAATDPVKTVPAAAVPVGAATSTLETPPGKLTDGVPASPATDTDASAPGVLTEATPAGAATATLAARPLTFAPPIAVPARAATVTLAGPGPARVTLATPTGAATETLATRPLTLTLDADAGMVSIGLVRTRVRGIACWVGTLPPPPPPVDGMNVAMAAAHCELELMVIWQDCAPADDVTWYASRPVFGPLVEVDSRPEVYPEVSPDSVSAVDAYARDATTSSCACVVEAVEPVATVVLDPVVPAVTSSGLAAHPVDEFHSRIVAPLLCPVPPVKLNENDVVPAVTPPEPTMAYQIAAPTLDAIPWKLPACDHPVGPEIVMLLPSSKQTTSRFPVVTPEPRVTENGEDVFWFRVFDWTDVMVATSGLPDALLVNGGHLIWQHQAVRARLDRGYDR